VILRDGFDTALFGAARQTPGCPEVHQHGLRRFGGQGVCAAVKLHADQRRRRAVHHVALLPGADACDEYDEQQKLQRAIAPDFAAARFFSGSVQSGLTIARDSMNSHQ
jgi:hypothetical protein